MQIDENLVSAIVNGAMPFLIVLIVFGAPVLFFYLRWSFKLREKELDLQRELALRGVGEFAGRRLASSPGSEAGQAQRVRVEPARAGSADEGRELDLALPEAREANLLAASNEARVDERVKF